MIGERLIVGVEDDPIDGSLRVYVDARWKGIHTHVADETAKTKIRNAWAAARTHITAPIPADALCDCSDEDADGAPCCPDPGCTGRNGGPCTFPGYADNH